MTEEEQRIAIAEFCGYTFHQIEVQGMLDVEFRLNGKLADPPPHYTNDLNAMHESEKLLDISQRSLMAGRLQHDFGDMGSIFTTASQRAEALLRTIGKWKE